MMKKWLIFGVVMALLIPATIATYLYTHYEKAAIIADRISLDFKGEDRPDVRPITEPFNVLLLGIGDRPGDPGRADTVMYASVNPKTESIFVFSLPRDMYVPIAGMEISDKLNHSFAYGRTEMTLETVEQYLDTSIDYVVQLNMNGLRQLVDAFGGIYVDNPFAFEQRNELSTETHTYDEGRIFLNGERALHYARMRKVDPKGDLGRNIRQRQVIEAILEKADTPKTVLKIPELLDIVGDNMRTNLTLNQMINMFQNYQKEWQHYEMDTLEVVGNHSLTNNVYYYTVDEDTHQYIQLQVASHLDEDPTLYKATKEAYQELFKDRANPELINHF